MWKARRVDIGHLIFLRVLQGVVGVVQTYMLDTNVFNDVLDRKISFGSFTGRRMLVIGVQAAELRATPETLRREKLLVVFEEINPDTVPTSSFAFDVEGAGLDLAYPVNADTRYM